MSLLPLVVVVARVDVETEVVGVVVDEVVLRVVGVVVNPCGDVVDRIGVPAGKEDKVFPTYQRIIAIT